MIRDGEGFRKIYLCLEPVDMRRGIDSLAASLIYEYHLNIFENKGCLYLFHGRNSRIIKGICFEGIGIGIYKLRLSEGNRFQWPKTVAEAQALTPDQYRALMSGIAFAGTITERYPKVQLSDPTA
jgi:transposase